MFALLTRLKNRRAMRATNAAYAAIEATQNAERLQSLLDATERGELKWQNGIERVNGAQLQLIDFYVTIAPYLSVSSADGTGHLPLTGENGKRLINFIRSQRDNGARDSLARLNAS